MSVRVRAAGTVASVRLSALPRTTPPRRSRKPGRYGDRGNQIKDKKDKHKEVKTIKDRG
jgi:hypothetical protein